MTDFVLSTDNGGGVVTLTLNRPELRNPISDLAMIDALVNSIKSVDADSGTRCVVLTGAGSAFSAGGNLKTMGKNMGLVSDEPNQTRLNYRNGIQRIPIAFHDVEVPVIAAVNGPAIGAGCDLACMCDIRVAATSAYFAESFVKLGLIPGDGGAWLLPRIIGFSKASEMALTGDPIDAWQALGYGLVSKVVPGAILLETAVSMARRIAANPPHAVRLTKRLLREGQEVSLSAVLELSAAAQALMHHTPDHEQALTAFFEKRL